MASLTHLLENNRTELRNYVCPRCDLLLRDAVQQMCCGHWMCECCAKELSRERLPRCPLKDCQELWSDDGNTPGNTPYFPDRFVRKTLSKVSIMCIHTECDWKGILEELSQHLRVCDFGQEQCTSCKLWIKRNEVKSHEGMCPGALTLCGFLELGCGHTQKMTQEQLVEHLTAPVNLASHLQIIGKLLKGLLVDSDDVEKDGAESSTQPAPSRGAIPAYKETFQKRFRLVETDGAGGTEGAVGGHYDTSTCQAVLEEKLREMQGSDKSQRLLSFMAELETLRRSLTDKDQMIKALQEKLQKMEKLVQSKSSEGEDRDFRLSLIENSNFDGTMIWKIPQFSQRANDARSGKYTSIFSLPFYSGRYGYKMCLRLYILGDGIGKGTHMSLFFVVMKGEFDAILQWPFTHKVSFRLINQRHGRDIVDVFQPDPLSSSFQRPKTDMNVASGCPRFISQNELNQGGFIVDDTIFIKVKVDTTTIKHP